MLVTLFQQLICGTHFKTQYLKSEPQILGNTIPTENLQYTFYNSTFKI